MPTLELLDSELLRRLIESSLLYLSNMSRLSFDESYRMIVRIGHIDDGFVRIRDAQDTSISLVEILRHMTWTSLSLAQLGATTAQPGESPPPSVIVMGGFDGSLVRMLRTDSDGRLQVGVTSIAKGDWLSAIPNPPNLDRSLHTVKRELLSLAPASGRGASVPIDDYVHWVDSAEYSVTETSWTEKTRCWVRPRNLPSRTYLVHVRVEGYVSAGQTLYVRFRSHHGGILASFTFTETSYVGKEKNATYIAPGWWDDPIYVEAYVTGGTGYIKEVQINFVRVNVVEGWSGVISEGEHFRPLRIDGDGHLQVDVLTTSNPPNLDVSLSALSRLVRWGRDVSPTWVYGGETTAPAAGTTLVSRTVSSGKSGYVYGVYVSSGEPNVFRLSWTSGGQSYSLRLEFPGRGSLYFVGEVPFNEGLPADGGSTIRITNVGAGSSGVVYQAGLLYAEV